MNAKISFAALLFTIAFDGEQSIYVFTFADTYGSPRAVVAEPMSVRDDGVIKISKTGSSAVDDFVTICCTAAASSAKA